MESNSPTNGGQSVPRAATPPQPMTAQAVQERPNPPALNYREIVVISHSALLYWWPVWVVGYVMAALTYWQGEPIQIGATRNWFYPSSNLGVIFFLTLFLVVVATNTTERGLASALTIVSIVLVTVLLAYLDWWESILTWFGNLKIYLNLGAYFWLSTLVLIVWLLTVFVFDRMSYWRFKPGQVTHEFVLGAEAKSFDTDNMILVEHRDDVFRHWLFAFGAGDMIVKPYGADREEILIPNVLFIGPKVRVIEHMLATEPGSLPRDVR